MPYTDFTELLTKIQQQNIGSGLILSAQAQMMAKQDEALKETLALYNKSKLDIDGQLRTTNEQLKQISESDLIKEGGKSLEELAQQYTSVLALSLQQQNELQNLVGSTQQRLANIGTPEALKQIDILNTELNNKTRMLEQQAQVPLKRIEFQKNLFDISVAKTNDEASKLELKNLKKNIEVMDRVSKVISYTETGKNGETVSPWVELASYLSYNSETGKINYEKKLEEFYEKIDNLLGDDPYKADVIKAIDLEVSKRIRVYNPPDNSGIRQRDLEGLIKDANYTSKLYNWLNVQSKNFAEINHSPDYNEVRKLYDKSAEEYITELKNKGVKLSYNQEQDIRTFGKSKEVAERIKTYNPALAKAIIRSDNLPTNPADVVEYMYKTFYDNKNSENYWNILNTFKEKIRLPKFPNIEMTTDAYGRRTVKENLYEINVLGTPIEFNLTSLMNNDAGEWNYYSEMYQGFKTYQEELYDKTEAPNKPKNNQSTGKMPTFFELKYQ